MSSLSWWLRLLSCQVRDRETLKSKNLVISIMSRMRTPTMRMTLPTPEVSNQMKTSQVKKMKASSKKRVKASWARWKAADRAQRNLTTGKPSSRNQKRQSLVKVRNLSTLRIPKSPNSLNLQTTLRNRSQVHQIIQAPPPTVFQRPPRVYPNNSKTVRTVASLHLSTIIPAASNLTINRVIEPDKSNNQNNRLGSVVNRVTELVKSNNQNNHLGSVVNRVTGLIKNNSQISLPELVVNRVIGLVKNNSQISLPELVVNRVIGLVKSQNSLYRKLAAVSPLPLPHQLARLPTNTSHIVSKLLANYQSLSMRQKIQTNQKTRSPIEACKAW